MSNNSWSVTDCNGVAHTISFNRKWTGKMEIQVDMDVYQVKSSNWFINLVDYEIMLPGTNCHVVVIGNKVDLTINGVYVSNGKPFEPINKLPAWIWVLVGLSVIGGFLFGGWLFMFLGAAISMFALQLIMNKKTGIAILLYCIFAVVLALWFMVQIRLQLGGYL